MRFTRFPSALAAHTALCSPRGGTLSGPCRLKKDRYPLFPGLEVFDHAKSPGCHARAPYHLVSRTP
jgi:hypothetical protein